MTRKSTRMESVGANPHSSDAAVNVNTLQVISRLRPKWLASHPASGSTTALAARYEVSAQVDSSIEADRLPAM